MRLSNNILTNRVALYHVVSTLSASTGAAIVGTGTEYPSPYAKGVRASVQPVTPQGGVHREFYAGTTNWDVYFRAAPGLLPTDLVVWTDKAGKVRYLVVALVRELAGRGGAWLAECYEKLGP